jgi:hypothetical protein
MNARRAREIRRQSGPKLRQHLVRVLLLTDEIVELDLGRRYRDGAWFCAECGRVDGCEHDQGYCVARVREAARMRPGALLRA